MPNEIFALKDDLEELVRRFDRNEFIDHDPIQFMHAFSDKRDQELAGFFAAIMAWGRRDIVIAKVDDLLNRMNYRPYEFILNFSESDAEYFSDFKHRTFKPIDIYWLIKTLKNILIEFSSFEGFWKLCYDISKEQERELIAIFHEQFFSIHPEIPQRTRKHISNPDKNSSCKRLYMYLRWCIRKSDVDLGIMTFMSPAELKIPLDVHVGNQARKMGLLNRKQNDWKAVLELNERLVLLDPMDPAKYDFALFGSGVLKSND
ncbi:MAG: TIGR02757 family protein [Balneola sp.]|nr:MAG: TIGR02757 family protein [Balneola sp.]